jgi:ATP-dependent Clp protease ATP-binding subunit ClpC
MEEGRLSDAKGRVVDFKNTIVAMTSNSGAQFLNTRGEMGFAPPRRDEAESEAAEYKRTQELVMPQVRELFQPEFLNRVDDVIMFHALTRAQVRAILDLMVAQTTARLREQMLELEVTEAAKDLLADKGYDREYGARPLRRTVQQLLEDRLAEALLRGTIKAGERVMVDRAEGDELTITPVEQELKVGPGDPQARRLPGRGGR